MKFIITARFRSEEWSENFVVCGDQTCDLAFQNKTCYVLCPISSLGSHLIEGCRIGCGCCWTTDLRYISPNTSFSITSNFVTDTMNSVHILSSGSDECKQPAFKVFSNPAFSQPSYLCHETFDVKLVW